MVVETGSEVFDCEVSELLDVLVASEQAARANTRTIAIGTPRFT
jgi:hypothetical protein